MNVRNQLCDSGFYVSWAPIRCDGANLQAAATRPGSPPEPKPSRRCQRVRMIHQRARSTRKEATIAKPHSLLEMISPKHSLTYSPPQGRRQDRRRVRPRGRRDTALGSRPPRRQLVNNNLNDDEARTMNGDGRLERKHDQSDLRRKELCSG